MRLMGGKDNGGKPRTEPDRRRSNGSRQPAAGDVFTDDPLDPMLEVKKRARRRLIGAIALVIGAIVVVPMLFDSGQKPTATDVAIQIPARDSEFPASGKQPDAAQDTHTASGVVHRDAPVSAQDSSDASATNGSEPDAASPAGIDASAERKLPASQPPAQPRTAAAPAEPAARPADKSSRDRAAPPASPKPAPSAREDARAMALLEGKSPELAASDGAKPPSGAKGNADAAADSKPESFVVQIGAFSDAAKAQSLKDKLAGGGLKPYTEVVQTTEGERTRLRVGPYSTREAADKAQERVRKLFAIDAKVVPL